MQFKKLGARESSEHFVIGLRSVRLEHEPIRKNESRRKKREHDKRPAFLKFSVTVAALMIRVRHCLSTHLKRVSDASLCAAFGVNWAQLASKTSAVSVLGEDSDPLTRLLPQVLILSRGSSSLRLASCVQQRSRRQKRENIRGSGKCLVVTEIY